MPAKKLRCTAKDCREPAQRIVGDCTFCNGHFCGKHRLLEDHKCSGLEDVRFITVSSPSSHPQVFLFSSANAWHAVQEAVSRT
jgi:predicted nucleic acid binding AN1-type Zn finger protein